MHHDGTLFDSNELEVIRRKLGAFPFRKPKLIARAFVARTAPEETMRLAGGHNAGLALAGDPYINWRLVSYLQQDHGDVPAKLQMFKDYFLTNRHFADLIRRFGLDEHLIGGTGNDPTVELGTLYEAIVCALEQDQPDRAQSFLYRSLLSEAGTYASVFERLGLFAPDDPRFVLGVLALQRFDALPKFGMPRRAHDHHAGRLVWKAVVNVGHLFSLEGIGPTPLSSLHDAARRAQQLLVSGIFHYRDNNDVAQAMTGRPASHMTTEGDGIDAETLLALVPGAGHPRQLSAAGLDGASA